MAFFVPPGPERGFLFDQSYLWFLAAQQVLVLTSFTKFGHAQHKFLGYGHRPMLFKSAPNLASHNALPSLSSLHLGDSSVGNGGGNGSLLSATSPWDTPTLLESVLGVSTRRAGGFLKLIETLIAKCCCCCDGLVVLFFLLFFYC